MTYLECFYKTVYAIGKEVHGLVSTTHTTTTTKQLTNKTHNPNKTNNIVLVEGEHWQSSCSIVDQYGLHTDPEEIGRRVNLSEDQSMYCTPHYVDQGRKVWFCYS